MFKDYYLILGVSKAATPEEIEKAFKDANERCNGATSSQEFQDVREAFAVLSQPENRALYDRELEAFNSSEDFENYEIKDQQLARVISSLQPTSYESEESSSGCALKIGKGCMWTFVAIILFMLQTCFGAIMKQRGRNAVRNSYSYVMPQNNKSLCLRTITNF